ncbi:MAG TPA: RNA-guided endonuclease TnpB family protein [Ktedonobacterales bacterium]|jgi:putative transposase|nr:RNA-guided endonuclease TnpB family protein [Ktedonobacterales bacterium]
MEQRRAYRHRFYPTPDQAAILARTFGCARSVYTWALRLRTDAYYERQQRLGYHEVSAALTGLKQHPETAWLNTVSSVPLQQALRHLDSAFRNVFEGRMKYPTFKKKRGRQAATYASSAFRWDANARTLIPATMDTPLDVRWSRALIATPSTVTISKDTAGRYVVSFLVEEDIQALPAVDMQVGVDVGLKDLALLSSGEQVANPKHLRQSERKLAHAQRNLARRKLGSKNRDKARLKLARLHAKIADQRFDGLHKLTTRLMRENQVVCVESLAVKHMVRTPTLAKSISDVGWGELVRRLEYKAHWYGRTLVRIDCWYPSSRRCHACGYIYDALTLDVRQWTCPNCGVRHDRDINAAKNLLAVGRAVSACGETARPRRAMAQMPDPARRDVAGIPRL